MCYQFIVAMPHFHCCESTDACCHPAGRCYRYAGLVFMCFLVFGNYFVYDNPAALADPLETVMGLSARSYSLLYSVYTWPNVFLSFFGGYVIDRFLGIRWGSILFATFVAFGQILFGLGALVNHFWLMVLGRLVACCDCMFRMLLGTATVRSVTT